MKYITHQSDIINVMSSVEKQMLTTVNAVTGKTWELVRLTAIFPDRNVYRVYPEQVDSKEWKHSVVTQYNDGRIVVEEESEDNDFTGEIFEKTEDKVWKFAEELGYEGDECFSLDIARASSGYISLLTHIDDDNSHYHILFESIDIEPVIRLATEREKLYLGYFFVRQEERAIRLAKQIGEIMLLKQRMDEETRISYFAKVKDEKGGVHFLDIYYLENSEASIIESKDFKGLENYEEDSEYRYYREIIQEWMQRYREAAAKGLSFEGSDIATI